MGVVNIPARVPMKLAIERADISSLKTTLVKNACASSDSIEASHPHKFVPTQFVLLVKRGLRESLISVSSPSILIRLSLFKLPLFEDNLPCCAVQDLPLAYSKFSR